MNTKKTTIGFVGFGEVNTPREIIERKCESAIATLEGLDLSLVVTPPVSDDPAGNESGRKM